MDQARGPGIRIHQIFLESASFSHRPDFLSVPSSPPPRMEISTQLQAEFAKDASDTTLGALRLIYKTDDASSLYQFSVTMIAIIAQDRDGANMTLQEYVESSAVALLVPFLREAVANLTGRGRFGPVWLHPLNVRALLGSPAIAELAHASGTQD